MEPNVFDVKGWGKLKKPQSRLGQDSKNPKGPRALNKCFRPQSTN